MSMRQFLRQGPYWPPAKASERLALPSGRKFLVAAMRKNDEDGRLEATVNIVSRGGMRLLALNREEFADLVRSSDRLRSYCKLWEQKGAMNSHVLALGGCQSEVNNM